MRRLVIALLLFVGFGTICALRYTEKTFFMPQPLRIPEQQIVFDDRSAHLQATYVYRDSDNRCDIGRYFGRNGKHEITIGSGTTDFQAANFIFRKDPNTLEGSFTLKPSRQEKGVHLRYVRRLTKLSKRLFFSLAMPIVRVTHNFNARCRNTRLEEVEGKRVGVLTYFTGNLRQEVQENKQDVLRCAKMNCCKKFGKSGIADLTCSLEYQLGKNDMYYLKPSLNVVIPAGNRPNGCLLFEPILGNGDHWGIGLGIEAMTVLRTFDKTTIDLTCAYNIKHFFSNTQRRTLGFRSDDWSSVKAWSHYELLGEKGKFGVFPAANVLTRDVKVRPGLLFNCSIDCNINHRDCLLTFGYNYFSREQEEVLVKCWKNDTYALANPSQYDGTQAFVITPNPDPATHHNLEGAIQKAMLDTNVASSPTIATHKFHGFVSFLRRVPTPFVVGVGAAYEFSQDNAALEGYELYARFGLSF